MSYSHGIPGGEASKEKHENDSRPTQRHDHSASRDEDLRVQDRRKKQHGKTEVAKKKKNHKPEQPMRSMACLINFKTPMPRDMVCLMPQFESSGCAGMLRKPWSVLLPKLVKEIMLYNHGAQQFDADHRANYLKWEPKHFHQVYGLPTEGITMDSKNYMEVCTKHFSQKLGRDGWALNSCTNENLRSVLFIMNSILNPMKPRKIVARVANVVIRAFVCDEKVNWAGIMATNFRRMAEKAGYQRKCALSPFLYHLYDHFDLLTEIEREEANSQIVSCNAEIKASVTLVEDSSSNGSVVASPGEDTDSDVMCSRNAMSHTPKDEERRAVMMVDHANETLPLANGGSTYGLTTDLEQPQGLHFSRSDQCKLLASRDQQNCHSSSSQEDEVPTGVTREDSVELLPQDFSTEFATFLKLKEHEQVHNRRGELPVQSTEDLTLLDGGEDRVHHSAKLRSEERVASTRHPLLPLCRELEQEKSPELLDHQDLESTFPKVFCNPEFFSNLLAIDRERAMIETRGKSLLLKINRWRGLLTDSDNEFGCHPESGCDSGADAGGERHDEDGSVSCGDIKHG